MASPDTAEPRITTAAGLDENRSSLLPWPEQLRTDVVLLVLNAVRLALILIRMDQSRRRSCRTRSCRGRLTVVHAAPLPDQLGGPGLSEQP
ncbi:hypothetical protein [Streptomyces sp. NPDC056255]|uniref:hypothetical protein n=1 Tax=Streptomyces sp. NPDC056255 TaxID=3345764 RepID=UPI0035D576DF